MFNKSITARKVSKYRVFSGPYFRVFELNAEIYVVNRKSPYSVQMQENTDQKKLCIWTLSAQSIEKTSGRKTQDSDKPPQ